MALRALVTGASGLVGSHVAERLVGAGFDVRALVRPATDVAFLRALGVALHRGDIRDDASVRAACRGVDVVIHAAALLGEWAPREQFEEMNVTAVRRVVEAAADGGVGRVVHVSSVAVYGRAVGRDLAETAPCARIGHPYVDTKADGERVAGAAGRDAGIEIVIIRPCMIYGPRDRSFLPHICRSLRRRRMVIVGSGSHACNTVYAGTVADLILVAATHPRAPGEALNVADPSPLCWRELLAVVAARLALPPPRLAVPLRAAWALGGLMEIAARAIRTPKPPPMTRFVADALGRDVSYSTRKASDLLGFTSRISVQEGLDRSLPHFLAA